MVAKNDSIALEMFRELLDHQSRFSNALQRQDLVEMTLAFYELENLSLLLLADICDAPNAKVKLLEAVVASKEKLEFFENQEEGSRF